MSHPLHKQEDLTRNKERSKNDLVVLRQPFRQINVEVIRPLIRMASGQIGERAAAIIQCQNQALEHYNPAQKPRHREVIRLGLDWNCHNAASKEHPDCRVQHLDSKQDRWMVPEVCHVGASLEHLNLDLR